MRDFANANPPWGLGGDEGHAGGWGEASAPLRCHSEDPRKAGREDRVPARRFDEHRAQVAARSRAGMLSVSEVALAKLEAVVLRAPSAEDRTGGVAAPYWHLTDGPDPAKRQHRHQPTVSHLRAYWLGTDDLRCLPQRGVRSTTRRGRRATYRAPSVENREAWAACPGVRRRISASPCRSRSRNRWFEFGSTDPTQERSGVLLPGISFNAFRNSKRVLRGSAWSRQLITKPFLPRRKTS